MERLEERLLLTTLLVNNPADAAVAGELSLRQAVAQANSDAVKGTSDTITFDPSLGSQTITLTQGQLELSGAGTGTITIDGSSRSTPLTISSAFNGRIFQIDGGVQAVLANLSLQDSSVSNGLSGGAVLNSGTLTVGNSTISDSSAYGGGSGGGIENTGSLTLSNDVFSNNYAVGNGGAVDNNGGSVTINDCTFGRDNQGTYGGAIDNENQGTLRLSGSTFSGNTAGNSGGAVENNASTATLNGDIFSNVSGGNYASDYGGGIDNQQGTLTLAASILAGGSAGTAGGGINNTGGTVQIVNSTVSGNTASTAGGGIANASGMLALSNSTVSGNTTYKLGGGIENASGGTLSATDSTFSANTAYVSGGGIENVSGGTLSLRDSTVSANNGYTSGGGIDNSGTLTLQNSIAAANAGNSTTPDISGVISTDSGNNLLGTLVHNSTNDPTPGAGDVFSDQPKLSTLGSYGGPTQTMALLTGSPAIAAGNAAVTPPATLPATDQRGLPRTVGGSLDIGAFQTQAPSVVFTTLGQTFPAGQPATFSVQLEDLDGNPATAGSGGVTVSLASSSTGGVFLDAFGNPLSNSSLTIAQGAGSATFEYQDSQAGSPTLTISATGFGSATQPETVLPPPISATPSTNIVVGRTLSAYFTGSVQNNQETITYTVYNESADPESGVLLTDTLATGVTLASASQQPDGALGTLGHGQNLAWSLGTIQAYDWSSVTITVSLSSSAILQLDTGAQAFATLNAGAISNSSPAATLASGTVDPNLLASTPDANTTDPYIQEEAAALDYNAQNIFNFLHDTIGYNAYSGSLRGARGTLWSSGGNALDVASLGIALLRASGIPAQYAEGTLSYAQTQQLILAMFPTNYQTVGYIPSGTQTSDPADDYQLQSETQSHYWFQYNAGNGWVNADPLMAGATLGQTFAATTGTFSEVPQSLRQTTEVSLTAEIYSQAEAAFGLGGNGLSDNVVLDQTFNDVDLVGRPLTVGNFVTQSGFGAVFSEVTNTYTPYIQMGDAAFPDSSQDELFTGTQYQEVLTNFPLGNQILTGLFLNMTLAGAGMTAQTYERSLVDRIGYAAREGLAPPANLSANPSGPPIITSSDLYTLDILGSLYDSQTPISLQQRISSEQSQLLALQAAGETNTTELGSLQSTLLTDITRLQAVDFLQLSDQSISRLASLSSVISYFAQPRIVISFSNVVSGSGGGTSTVEFGIDLRTDTAMAIALPGQATNAAIAFNIARGIGETISENMTTQLLSGGGQQGTIYNTVLVLQAAQSQGIPIIYLLPSDLPNLSSLVVASPDALARISDALTAGNAVVVPARPVALGGQSVTAWYQINPQTGNTIGVTQDGGHQSTTEWAAIVTLFGLVIGYDIGLFTITVIPPKQVKQWKADMANLGIPGALILGLFGVSGGKGGISGNEAGLVGLFIAAVGFSFNLTLRLAGVDPPADSQLYSDLPDTSTLRQALATTSVTSTMSSGAISGDATYANETIAGNLVATWTGTGVNSFQAQSLTASAATVSNASGTSVGSGTVALNTADAIPLSVSGNVDYNVNGVGSLSFYGPAESSLGVSGNWSSYSASASGNVSLTITTGDLVLNGTALPAGTYTITTNSAALSGSGQTTLPNFSGSVAITATDSTLQLGPDSGSISSGGKPLDPASGATLDGYTGTINVSAIGNGSDLVTLDGNSTSVLQVLGSPAALTTDENTPVTFQADVSTSFADTYTLTANAPQGWTLAIDDAGNVTATPAPGLQGGTYPIQIIAQSTADPNLVAQSTVDVTITPTQPGMTLAVTPDPSLTVPFNGRKCRRRFRW